MTGIGPVRGDHRIVAGRSEFCTGQHWIPYPATLVALIEHAITYGWGFDDGLPIRYRHVSEAGEVHSQPYIRVLIGREAGAIAGSDEKSPGIQFHLLAPMTQRAWGKPDGYVKTSESGLWVGISGLDEVRRTIVQNRVIGENPYAEADN